MGCNLCSHEGVYDVIGSGGGGGGGSLPAEGGGIAEQPTEGEPTEEAAAQLCELYCALCTKKHALLRGLFEAYAQVRLWQALGIATAIPECACPWVAYTLLQALKGERWRMFVSANPAHVKE